MGTQTFKLGRNVLIYADDNNEVIGWKFVNTDAKEGWIDDPDWITVENGQHVPLDETGTVAGGAGGSMKGKVFSNAKSQKSKKKATATPEKAEQPASIPEEKTPAEEHPPETQSAENTGGTESTAKPTIAFSKVTKKRYNEQLNGILDTTSGEERVNQLEALLDTLPVGSEIRMPDTWVNDDGTVDIVVKTKQGKWETKRKGAYGWALSQYDLVWYFSSEEKPTIQKVARSEEEKAADLQKKIAGNWRENGTSWRNKESLEETVTTKLQKFDLDKCGEGYTLTGSDGKQYIKYDGKWYEEETYHPADMRKLNSREFTGDFYDYNLGLNGVSKSECDALRTKMQNLSGTVKDIYEDQLKKTKIALAYNGGSCYTRFNDTIHLGEYADAETLLHESSHRLDNYAYKPKEVQLEGFTVIVQSASCNMDILASEERNSDFEAMAKVVGFETNGNGWFAGSHSTDSDDNVRNRVETYCEFSRKYRSIEGFSCISDIISALTENQCGETMYGGHPTEYWRRAYGADVASSRATEFWAEYCTMRANKQDQALELAKSIAPSMYSAAEQTYKEVFGE